MTVLILAYMASVVRLMRKDGLTLTAALRESFAYVRRLRTWKRVRQ